MKMIEQGINHEEVMKHKLNKLKEFEPELTKRKKTEKTKSWQGYGENLPNTNIKFKIKSVDVEGDKAIVTIDIYDVVNRVNDKEVPTTQNYLKGEITDQSNAHSAMKDIQKTFSLPSYKLDYVASKFIRGEVNKYKILDDNNIELECKTIQDIQIGDYIHIEITKGYISDEIGDKYLVKKIICNVNPKKFSKNYDY
jgi:hypothetical protein